MRRYALVWMLCGAVVGSGSGGAEAQTFVPVAHGVEFMQRTDPGPRRISALRVNLCAAGVRMRATASGERGARTSSWASGAGVVAAVNGGFFLSGARPDAGVAAGGGQEWPDSQDSAVRGFVAFGARQLTHSPAPEVVALPAWAEEAVNGDATLVQDGAAINCGGCGGGRAPRTAVGYSRDRATLTLVVVDGRSTSSVGMTIDELAVLMASFGVDRAMNLDGGGSSTMWVDGRGVVNRPSDGSERTVANHLGIVATGAGVPHNCPLGYGSEYVRSGFPGGTTRFVLEQGATVSGDLQFRNTGTYAWDSSTRLATIPRDEPSPVAAASWLIPWRITAPDARTEPGEVGVFSFTLRAPDTPGVYRQYLNLVQEGVTWFADSWGPADNVYYVEVESVAAPRWRAELIEVGGWPAGRFAMAPGEVREGWVEVRNTGTLTWPVEEVRLATTEPRNDTSPLEAPGWFTYRRPAVNSVEVAPGETHRFTFALQAPAEAGVYEETFGLVHEGLRWFADDGGPADDFVRFTIDVEQPAADDVGPADAGDAGVGDDVGADAPSSPDSAGDSATPQDSGDEGDGASEGDSAGDSATPQDGAAGADASLRSGSETRSEGCATAAGGGAPPVGAWWLVALGWVLARRRG